MSQPFFLDFVHFFNALTLHYIIKLPTLLTILIMDVKNGRFRYQSRRVGDVPKKRKMASLLSCSVFSEEPGSA